MCIYTCICAICIFILVSFPRFCWEGLRAARASRLIIDCAVLGRHRGNSTSIWKPTCRFLTQLCVFVDKQGAKWNTAKERNTLGYLFWWSSGYNLMGCHWRFQEATRCSAAGAFSLQILHYIFSGQKLTRENRKQARADTTGICIYYLVNVALKCIEDRSI